jgi:3-methylcrotonyl-CoA carboxylase alpha subunit
MFGKLLIANRGEIAVRIARTARRMGIRTVAVHSDADRDALHVAVADEAVRLGPAPAAESYLSIGRLLDAARRTGADAVHPGYGFLSENPEFAETVAAAGLVFVGPPAHAIRAMGLKDESKRRMQSAGVPVVPGYHGEDDDPERLLAEAKRIGFPVLIKARAGGGGKGMRRVEGPEAFLDALASARREGEASFGDPACLVEAYVSRPRHIEVQVFGDSFGDVVHLFERDCSLQRRHQKVIEEAPAPGMSAPMREAICEAAVKAARAIGYVGAGTVEFIADASDGLREDRFYFMEMNTRLQVEHPVTEAVTGVDLVEWQLRVAAGEPLPLAQDGIRLDGSAVEARLYAEDPARGFLPAPGRLVHLDLPDDLARVDAGVRPGDTVTPWYDPMIAKVIVHRPTREAAFAALAAALDRCRAAGTRTNAAFLARLARDADVTAGAVHTALIEDRIETLTSAAPPAAATVFAAALSTLDLARSRDGARNPFDALVGWRLWPGTPSGVRLEHGGRVVEVAVAAISDGYEVVHAGASHRVRVADAGPGNLALDIDGHHLRLDVIRDGAAITVFEGAEPHVFTLPAAIADLDAAEADEDRVVSPMPGLVRLVAVEPGADVRKGEILAVVEAMKMEHALAAPRDGTVASVPVAAGEQVAEGAVMVSLEPPP